MARPVLSHERFGHGPEQVIVLHEFYGSIRSWDPVRLYLDTEQFSFAFADLRGYGGSRRLEGEHSMLEIAADVEHLASALGAPRYHLVGHSMTGLAAQYALLRDAQGERRIERVVAVTPAPTDGFEHNAAVYAFLSATLSDDAALAKLLAMSTGERWGEGFIRYKIRLNRSSSQPEIMARYLENMVFYRGLAKEAGRLRPDTPLLVISGAHDGPAMRQSALKASMGDVFPAARWMELPGAGHYPMDECPVALASAICGFLGSKDPLVAGGLL